MSAATCEPPPEHRGHVREIPLTLGKVAIVDESDFDLVGQFRWHAHVGPGGLVYARRRINLGKNRFQGVFMHRLILGVSNKYVYVDHIDNDTLNNRRSNLRLCTGSQNSANRRTKCSPGRYKGVEFASPGSYRARIEVRGKKMSLGSYSNPVDAAMAYDTAARKFYGEFATLNFPYVGPAIPPQEGE